MSTRLASAAAGLLLLAPQLAYAHPGRAPEPHDLWHLWSAAPFVVASLVLSAACYAAGVRALWRRAGRGRGVSRWESLGFAGGLSAVALALLSPVDAVSNALFSVHMVQHLLLVLVAAPLLVLGAPQYAMLWVVPVVSRRRGAHWWHGAHLLQRSWATLRHPLVAWVLHVVTLWVWHAPRFYDAALRNSGIHVLEHLLFLLTALLFWWVVIRGRLTLGVATLYLFAAAMQGTLLGALITIARSPWYYGHYGTTQAWGLTPLEDQQIAGLIMWVPAGLVYLLALLPRWVRTLSHRSSSGAVLGAPVEGGLAATRG
jgi:putative membrane protein